jgi:hypothetical protein
VIDVAKAIVATCKPCGPGGEVCVSADLFERLCKAVYAEPES